MPGKLTPPTKPSEGTLGTVNPRSNLQPQREETVGEKAKTLPGQRLLKACLASDCNKNPAIHIFGTEVRKETRQDELGAASQQIVWLVLHFLAIFMDSCWVGPPLSD